MDKRVLRERMRRKRRQQRIRRYMKLGIYGIGTILAVIFVIRGVIMPIASRIGGGGKDDGKVVAVQAQTAEADPNAAVRQPLKGQQDVGKITEKTPGWHEDESGRWYQNADGTYFADGFQEIDGVNYSFDSNGYLQTGWVEKGVNDYFFNEDGSYNPTKKKPRIALTFDDGPSEYTMELLNVLEENNAKATFFMLGEHVDMYPDEIKKMVEIGCELGSHSWDHPNLLNLDLDSVAKQFKDVDDALIKVCGQAATVARTPYGAGNQDVFDTVGKPFFMWSLDTMDWSLLDADADYNAVMNGDLTDGSIILMHDIHEPSVKAAIRLIPDLVAKGYKLVTVSELAEAKGVTLQSAQYSDFWDSSLRNGLVTGWNGKESSLFAPDPNKTAEEGSGDGSSDDGSADDGEFTDDGSGDMTDGSDDGSGELSDGSGDGSEGISDGSESY